MKEQNGHECGMLTEGTERTGVRNVECRKRADWKAESLVEEQCVMERGILTEGTGWIGE
jgi:hypothetical protein